MRVVVTGATGNVGTSVPAALERDPHVTEIVGLARCAPASSLSLPKARRRQADVTVTHLAPLFDGAGVIVHLAWAIQPSHDERAMERVNVPGSRRMFDALGPGALRDGCRETVALTELLLATAERAELLTATVSESEGALA